jgi:HAD superfamily hydrolase (TIGR01490 family)
MNRNTKNELFDVDHTITKKSTAISYLMLLIKKKYLPISILKSVPLVCLNYKYGKMHESHFNRKIPELIGIKKEFLEEVAYENFIKYIKPSLYPGAVDYIKKLKDEGKRIIIASSSMEMVLKPLTDYLGIDDLIATRVAFEDNLCQGCFAGTPAFRNEKKKLVLDFAKDNNIDLDKTSFYSDSIHDRPLMEEVGNPVATNPDFRLKLLAKNKGWKILNF